MRLTTHLLLCIIPFVCSSSPSSVWFDPSVVEQTRVLMEQEAPGSVDFFLQWSIEESRITTFFKSLFVLRDEPRKRYGPHEFAFLVFYLYPDITPERLYKMVASANGFGSLDVGEAGRNKVPIFVSNMNRFVEELTRIPADEFRIIWENKHEPYEVTVQQLQVTGFRKYANRSVVKMWRHWCIEPLDTNTSPTSPCFYDITRNSWRLSKQTQARMFRIFALKTSSR